MTSYDPGPEDLYPMLRAENAEVLIHPSDRKYGALLVGGQGCGKSSALLSFYLNDIEDPDAAPIVIDPKSELSRICLRMTPPDCGKRVWFLDLGHPAFGMSPLRLIGDRPLAIEAAQIAENVVAALLDINENQIYQSSRRYLYHAVIGAIAIAHRDGTPREARGRLHAAAPRQGRVPSGGRGGVRGPGRPRPDRRVLPLRAARRPADGHQPRRRTARRAAQQDLRPHRRAAAQTVLQPPHRHPAAGDHRGAGHPDRRREHGRDRHREQQGLHAVHPADAARPAPAPGPPARGRAPARAAAGRRGALRRRRRERRRPDRHPPRRRPRARVRPAVLRAARLRLRAPAEDPQRRPQPAAEPLPVPDGRRRGRRAGHPDRDGRLRDDDPRRPRLPRPPARHPRAGAQLPQLLLPRLLDRPRHPRPELHGPDLPAPRRRRRVGRTPPRRPGRARRARTPSNWNRRSTPAQTQPKRTETAAGRRWRSHRSRRRRASTSPSPTTRRTPPNGSERGGTRTRRGGSSPRGSTPSRSRAGESLSVQRATARKARPPATGPDRRRMRGPGGLPMPRRRPSQAGMDARASARCASTTNRHPSRRTSPTARSDESSDTRYPGRRSRASISQRRTASASSRSSTGSTRSAQPSSSPAPTACHGCTTRTTRCSHCSTAWAWRHAR